MPRVKTEPFQWRSSQGILTHAMLREYIRWLFPQLGAAYIPPQGVKDFTLGQNQDRLKGQQPDAYRPSKASGVVLAPDFRAFKDHVFHAIGYEAQKAPYHLSIPCLIIFVPQLKKLHQHLTFLIAKKRLAEENA